ncbi:uncharacterized protein METZ01_LOCUS150984, partial [marine metagenome]
VVIGISLPLKGVKCSMLGSLYSKRGLEVQLVTISLGMAVGLLPPSLEPLSAQGDYRVVTVENGAVLQGRVTFGGEVPAPKRLLVTKDEEVCGFGYRERSDVSVVVDGGLLGVVVAIEGVKEGKEWSASMFEGRVVDQRDCIFQPHLQVIPKWTDVSIVNSDPVLHNIHAWELMEQGGRTLFNLGQPPERGVITQSLRPRRGSRIRLECDAHDFMQGWIYAADSPYAVATSEDGSFVMEDVPPGAYTITAWHPFLGIRAQVVKLDPDGESEITFNFTGN